MNFCQNCAISVEWGVQPSYRFPFLHPQFVMAEDVTLLLNVTLNARKANSQMSWPRGSFDILQSQQ